MPLGSGFLMCQKLTGKILNVLISVPLSCLTEVLVLLVLSSVIICGTLINWLCTLVLLTLRNRLLTKILDILVSLAIEALVTLNLFYHVILKISTKNPLLIGLGLFMLSINYRKI